MSTPVHPFVILCFGGTGLALTVLYRFELTPWKLRICLTGSARNILALQRTNGNRAVEELGVQFFFRSRTALTRSNLQVNNSGSGRARLLSLLIQKALAGHQPTDSFRTVRFNAANNQNAVQASAVVGSDKITPSVTGRRGYGVHENCV